MSVESSAPSTTANDASSSYCAERRSASVRTRRSGSRPASRRRAECLREIEARLGDERRRKTADGPEADLGRRVTLSVEQARHRGWIARPEKRPRRAPADVGVSDRGPANNRREILARRESTDGEKRLSDDRRGSGASGAVTRYCASAVRAAGVRILAERLSRLAPDRGRPGPAHQQLGQPRHRVGILQLTRRERHSRDDLDVVVFAR